MLVLSRFDMTGSTSIAEVETKDAGLREIVSRGYEIIEAHEDVDNPGCWDVAASRGRANVDIFVIEPKKGA